MYSLSQCGQHTCHEVVKQVSCHWFHTPAIWKDTVEMQRNVNCQWLLTGRKASLPCPLMAVISTPHFVSCTVVITFSTTHYFLHVKNLLSCDFRSNHWRTHGGGWEGFAGLQPPNPKAKLKNTQIFVDMIISNILRYLRFSLNQLPKLADQYAEILKNVIKLRVYRLNVSFSVSFNFLCNLTRCRLVDLDMIFITSL